MKPIEIGIIKEVTGGEFLKKGEVCTVTEVFQDSRQVKDGSVFFAIAGNLFDGHDYILSAVEKGACLIVADNREKAEKAFETDICEGVWLLLVENSIEALKKLAEYYLNSLSVIKIGVTGSSGKTTTRDMIYHVCKKKYVTYKNPGNYNTVVGVSLTILGMEEDAEVAVLEMGMDRAGEIHQIAGFVKPDIAVISNIGVSHLENFENRDGIFHAKMEITDFFDSRCKLIVSREERYLNENKICDEYPLIMTGISEKCQYKIKDIEEKDDLTVSFTVSTEKGEKERVRLPLPGVHNCLNAANAIAVGCELGIPLKKCAEGLEKMELTGARLRIEKKNGITVINDTYNANPESMKASLGVLKKALGRRVAVLGDMYELGNKEIEFHRETGEFARQCADVVYSIGKMSEVMKADKHFLTKEEFNNMAEKLIRPGDVILVKASHGMALDKVVEKLLDISYKN